MDSARIVTETPMSQVIHAHEGCACMHSWRMFWGQPGSMFTKIVADWFPASWLWDLEEDLENLAPVLRRRLELDPTFLDVLRAALPDQRKTQEVLDALRAWEPPPNPKRGAHE